MKARTCCLCGGKVRNGRCIECGMNNSRTDADIRVNQNDDTRGFIPRMTAQEMNRQAMARDRHVEADVRTQPRKTANPQQTRYTQTAQRQAQTAQRQPQKQPSSYSYTARTSRQVPPTAAPGTVPNTPYTGKTAKKKKNPIGTFVAVIVALTVLGNVVEGVETWIQEKSIDRSVEETIDSTFTLEASESVNDPEYVYVAGTDFPAGTYDLFYIGGSGSDVEVFHDEEVSYYYVSEEGSLFEGIELGEGDWIVSYWGESGLVSSENG